MGIFNTAIPFLLITWGEKSIDSGLASILNGAVPLFTIVIAHFWLHDEKITAPRIAGLIVGFIGIMVLVSRDFDLSGVLKSSVWGQVAVLLASISYAVAITFSRKYLRGQPPCSSIHDGLIDRRFNYLDFYSHRGAGCAQCRIADPAYEQLALVRRCMVGAAGFVCRLYPFLLPQQRLGTHTRLTRHLRLPGDRSLARHRLPQRSCRLAIVDRLVAGSRRHRVVNLKLKQKSALISTASTDATRNRSA